MSVVHSAECYHNVTDSSGSVTGCQHSSWQTDWYALPVSLHQTSVSNNAALSAPFSTITVTKCHDVTHFLRMCFVENLSLVFKKKLRSVSDIIFIQSNLQLIRLSRRHILWSNVGLRALLKGPTAVQILWPHQGWNHRPCRSKSSSLTTMLQAAPDMPQIWFDSGTKFSFVWRIFIIEFTQGIAGAAVATPPAQSAHSENRAGELISSPELISSSCFQSHQPTKPHRDQHSGQKRS